METFPRAEHSVNKLRRWPKPGQHVFAGEKLNVITGTPIAVEPASKLFVFACHKIKKKKKKNKKKKKKKNVASRVTESMYPSH